MARNKPSQNQPPQPSQAKAISKYLGRNGKRNGKQPLQPPQLSLAEAKAEVKPGNPQAQPPQPPLGDMPKQGNQDNSKVKPRRRRGRKRKKSSRTAPSSRNGEKCEQAEVNTQDKRLRASPQVTNHENYEQSPQSKCLRVGSPLVISQNGENGGNDQEEIVPLRLIKSKNLLFRRSSTLFFPRQSYFKPSKPSSNYKAHRLQRSRLHRANLKAKRDFPYTLESLARVSNSDTDSEYILISRVGSIPTSGQSSPEAPPEPISNEDLFGLRAKPCSPVPSTPSTWSLSSDSPLDSDHVT